MRLDAFRLQPVLALILIALPLSACAAPTAAPTAEPTGTPLPPATEIFSPAVPSDWIRPSAIAGSWYPDDPDELTAMVDEMLAVVEPVAGEPMALIVPHAGYVYSGLVAATGFRQLEGAQVDVAVVIASDHQPPRSKPISVWVGGGFETPLGIVPVDAELARALVEADPRITYDPAAHEEEHPIEIELPFLQRTCPGCCIVPVLMGDDDEETVRALAEALLALLPGRRAVVIVSSDLSHYPTYDDARVVDGATLAAIETGDPARVRETTDALMVAGVPNLMTCACGRGPILVAMHLAQGLGANMVTVLRYANSGDSPYGDQEQVVGYGAVMFWHYEPPDLTGTQQEELLALARTALEAYLEGGAVPAYETDDPVLIRRSGVFVTLKEQGEPRGCVGHTWADQPLYQAVQQTVVSAATKDARFPPLAREELAGVTIELSVLSPFRRVTDVAEIQVGTHGLMIFKDGRQGLLLPQVPVEEGWGREEFLDNLCLKAGLPPGCWQEGAGLYAFTAVVFGEGE